MVLTAFFSRIFYWPRRWTIWACSLRGFSHFSILPIHSLLLVFSLLLTPFLLSPSRFFLSFLLFSFSLLSFHLLPHSFPPSYSFPSHPFSVLPFLPPLYPRLPHTASPCRVPFSGRLMPVFLIFCWQSAIDLRVSSSVLERIQANCALCVPFHV